MPQNPLENAPELLYTSDQYCIVNWVEAIVMHCTDPLGDGEAEYRRVQELRVVDATLYQGRFSCHQYIIVEIVCKEQLHDLDAPRVYLRIERGSSPQMSFGTLVEAICQWAGADGSCVTGGDTIRRVDSLPWFDTVVGRVWWQGQGYTKCPTLLDLARVAHFLHKRCHAHFPERPCCQSLARDLCVLLGACSAGRYQALCPAGGWLASRVSGEADDGEHELYTRFLQSEKDEKAMVRRKGRLGLTTPVGLQMVWEKHGEEFSEVGLDNEVRHGSSEIIPRFNFLSRLEIVVAKIKMFNDELSLSAERRSLAAVHCIDGRLDRLEGRGGMLVDRVGTLEARVGALEPQVGAREVRVDALEARVGMLGEQIGVLEDQLHSFKGLVGGLEHPVGLLQGC